MILKFLLLKTFLTSMLFYLMKMSLSMGLILLTQSILISLISGMISMNFWYMYILFLIMLGGMLILFIYVSSLSSNQKFTLNKKFILIIIFFITMTWLILMMKINYLSLFNSNTMKILETSFEQNLMMKMSMNKLYNKPTNQIMIMLINYLLLILFIVVKTTNINMGPLRKNF
uniref:NADH-ubiquinone oxidoreductase chain 6 n=1 Tax=Colochela zhongi TaxID=2675636 RepID=A0A7G5VU09_9HYME|nr:NADH dehydrogenase subunit 6 [Colochela zhongi]